MPPTLTAALTLVILVARGTSRDPATLAMDKAVREAMGDSAHVVVQEVPEPPGDEDAIAIGKGAGADAVAKLVWTDDGHRHATLHVRVGAQARWADREIGFDTLDAEPERGRMIGFALASMMPPPGPAPLPPPPPADVASTLPSPPVSIAEPARARWRGAVDAACNAALGGGATGIGGALSGRWDFARAWSLRAGVAARGGHVPGADASSLTLYGAVGVVFRFLPESDRRPFGVAARVDFLGLRDEVKRPAADGGPSEASAWLPGADAAVEATWLFAERLSLFAGIGAEVAFGSTPVIVHGQTAATLPPMRGLGELGARLHF